MADNSPGSFFSAVSPQQVFAVLTLVGSLALMQFPPLQSRREAEKIASASVPNDNHLFHASDIEDPLGALAAQTLVHPENEKGFDPRSQVQGHTHWGFYTDQLLPHVYPPRAPAAAPGQPPPEEKPVLLVFAYLRSGEDVASKEQRQCDRQAVVYAMHNSGYVQEHERSLECLMLCKPTQKMLDGGMSEPWSPEYNPNSCINIPFEWFKSIPGGRSDVKTTDYKAVCVFWLDSEVFAKMQKSQDRPLDCLRSAIYNLTTGHPRPQRKPAPPAPPQPQPQKELLVKLQLLPHLQLFPQLKLTMQEPPPPPSPQPPLRAPVRELPLDQIKIGILGPPDSGTLTQFITEANKITEAKPGTAVPKHRWLGPIQMSSPYATASAQALLQLASETNEGVDTECRWDCEESVMSLMNKALAGTSPPGQSLFLSVPCTDDYVAKSLIHEMQVRGMSFEKGTGNPRVPAGVGDIVLLSEFDTSYGRELPLTLYNAALEQGLANSAKNPATQDSPEPTANSTPEPAAQEPPTSTNTNTKIHNQIAVRSLPGPVKDQEKAPEKNEGQAPAKAPAQVKLPPDALEWHWSDTNHWHWSSYTRGLDGRYGVAQSKSSKEDGGSGKSTDKNAADEEPRGINATDALRRLARQLKEQHELRQRENKPGIVAIGILGGDVYDQLLILRALRPSFPQALFFCNNLDAWLWTHDELRTTRNLVVATPFGLYLPERWQKGKPPFRTAYQTAVFAGTLALASSDPYLSPPTTRNLFASEDQLPERQKVHHYEIGHDGPVDLDCQGEELRTFWSPKPRKTFLRILVSMLALSWVCWLFFSNLPFIRHIWRQFTTLEDVTQPEVTQAKVTQTAAEFRAWAKDSFGRLMANPAWVFIIILLVLVTVHQAWKYTAVQAPAAHAAVVEHPHGTPPQEGAATLPKMSLVEAVEHTPPAHTPLVHTHVSEVEPLDFTSGISSWPFIAFNLVAALLGLHFILKALYLLWRGERHMKATYFPSIPDFDPLRGVWELALKTGVTIGKHAPHLQRMRDSIQKLNIGTYLRERRTYHRSQLATYFRQSCCSLLVAWNVPQIIIDTNRTFEHAYGENKDLHPGELWKAYRLSSKLSARLIRSAVVAAVIAWVALEMRHILPGDSFAIRGEKTRLIATWTECAGLAAFIWLGTLVFDTLWLNRIFIDWFGKGQSLWPREIVQGFFASQEHPEAHCDYIDLRLIEDWTREIGRLTSLPYYVLACLCIARLGWFDQADCPWPVIAILAFVAVLVILGALRVHHAAENLRLKALRNLDWKSKGQLESPEVEKISKLINGISGGAFMSFWRQPVMQGVYWLVSALSVTGLWQTLAQFAH